MFSKTIQELWGEVERGTPYAKSQPTSRLYIHSLLSVIPKVFIKSCGMSDYLTSTMGWLNNAKSLVKSLIKETFRADEPFKSHSVKSPFPWREWCVDNGERLLNFKSIHWWFLLQLHGNHKCWRISSILQLQNLNNWCHHHNCQTVQINAFFMVSKVLEIELLRGTQTDIGTRLAPIFLEAKKN